MERWRSNIANTSSVRHTDDIMIDDLKGRSKDNVEFILMKLWRLNRLMNKKDRYSERELCRSRVLRFLQRHLKHYSEKVRYLSLEVLCFSVPRLGAKVESVHKVIQCLRGDELKDIKLKALHFFRCYYRHTKHPESFLENFIQAAIESSNPDIQLSCFSGLNIVFDHSITDGLLTKLVVSVVNQLCQNNPRNVNRAGYMALKHIHQTIGVDRFSEMLSSAKSKAVRAYRSIYATEESDSFRSMKENDCDAVVLAYAIKREKFNFKKDFGIFDPKFLDQIGKTKNCEKAKAVSLMVAALNQTPWTERHLDPHVPDLLKLINSLISNNNRLVQMSGCTMLKTIVKRLGFVLAPHIRIIIKMLKPGLTSGNSKIKSKAEKVLDKLMISIHPMTAIWQLLDIQNSYPKVAALTIVREKIGNLFYHEIDVVPLCNFLALSLEDRDRSIFELSRSCISHLLKTMRDCPINENEFEAVRTLMKNYTLSREILDASPFSLNDHEQNSGDETTGLYMENSVFEEPERNETANILTAKYSYGKYVDDVFENKLEEDNQTDGERCSNSFKNVEFSDGSEPQLEVREDMISNHKAQHLSAENSSMTLNLNQNDDTSTHSNIIMPEQKNHPRNLQSRDVQRKCLTTFCMKTEPCDVQMCCPSDVNAGGDTERVFCRNASSMPTLNEDEKLALEYYERDDIRVDGMSKNLFNFNTMEEKHHEIADITQTECESSIFSLSSHQNSSNSLQIEYSAPKPPLSNESYIAHIVNSPSKPIEATVFSTTIATATPIYDDITPYTLRGKSISSAMNQDITKFIIGRTSTRYRMKSSMVSAEQDDEDKIIPLSKLQLESNFNRQQNNGLSNHPNNSADIISLKQIKAKVVEKIDASDGTTILPPSDDTKIKQSVVGRDDTEDKEISNTEMLDSNSTFCLEFAENRSISRCGEFDEIEAPFLPKTRELPRTPVEKKLDFTMDVQLKAPKTSKALHGEKKKTKSIQKTCKKSEVQSKKHSEGAAQMIENGSNSCDQKESEKNLSFLQSAASKQNTPSKWRDCQWRRDLDYASKALTSSWTVEFEKMIESMEPLPSNEAAESDMRKSLEILFGSSWKEKENAMLKVIRIAKYHPTLVHENTSKIAVALTNEIKNFRQSVAGKAILTIGHLYEMMGKHFESKLRMVVGALIVKSGTRTLAAYYRLVIQSLAKVIAATSPRKVATALMEEGTRQNNKAARETAAQFLCLLTESMGAEDCMVPSLAGPMMKCSATFVFDSSALTRCCGKRMFVILMEHSSFEKLKHSCLDVNTVQNLNKILHQLKTKGIRTEILPINLIE